MTKQVPTTTIDAKSEKGVFMTIIFVAIGILATTLPQPQVLGKIPLQHLLKSELHCKPEQVAFFFFLCGLFWYIKPLAGILTDAFPLFGTKRKAYALLSALLAAVSWIGLIFAPHEYNALLIGAIVVNLFMVMLSTVVGAVLVEVGQSTRSVGKITAVRQTVMNTCTLIQGPLGGWLATIGLSAACGVNAVFLLPMIPATYLLLKEKRFESRPAESFQNAGNQLRTIGKSATFWWALVFISLFYFAPGFSTLLYFRQNDILKLDQYTIGLLGSAGGAGAIIGSVTYAFFSSRFRLKSLLVFSTIAAAAVSLIYLGYNSLPLAYTIDFTNGLFFGFAEVAFIDLAARATPVGCEGLGYSLILSCRNLALFGADFLGAKFSDEWHLPWSTMVLINTFSTAIVVVLIPFIPQAIMATKDRSLNSLATQESLDEGLPSKDK